MNFIRTATNALESTTKSGNSLSKQSTEHSNNELTATDYTQNLDNEFTKRTQNVNESFKNASTSTLNNNEDDNKGLLGKFEDALSLGGKNRTHERNYSVDNTSYNDNNERSNNNDKNDSLIGGSLQKIHGINQTIDEKLSSFTSKKPQLNNSNNEITNNDATNNETSDGFFKNTINKVHGLNQGIENKVESAMGLIGIKPSSSSVTHNTPVHQSSQYNDSSFVERSRDNLDNIKSNQDDKKGLFGSAKDQISNLNGRDNSNNNNYDEAEIEDNTNKGRASSSSLMEGSRNRLYNIEEEVENKFNSKSNNPTSRTNNYNETDSNTSNTPSSFIDDTKSGLNNIGRKIENHFESINPRNSASRKSSIGYENNENDSNNDNYNRNNRSNDY